MTRRIVQIAAVGHENDQMWQGRTELFALCDDSTAWYQVHGEAAWVPIPDIPQDTPAVDPDPIAERTGPPNLRVGDRVLYVPGHAHGDIGHPDCENGTVSSFGVQQTAFVLYDGDTSPKATTRSDLVRFDTESPEPEEAPDPIAELEAMGGRLYGGVNCSLYWYGPGVMSEAIGTQGQTLSDIRAAAARLLARVRGGAK